MTVVESVEQRAATLKDKFDFHLTTERLQAILGTLDKLEFLEAVKTDYLRETRLIKRLSGLGLLLEEEFFKFGEKVEFEIEQNQTKFSREKDRRNIQPIISGKSETPTIPEERLRDRATLILDYLFRYAEAECTQKRKAESIAIVTRFSEKKIDQSFSKFKNEFAKMAENLEGDRDPEEDGDNFAKDIEFVSSFFSRLRLNDILTLIEADKKGNVSKITP